MYSGKQRELMRLWQTGQLKRINILQGSVRSGKTWVSLVLWAFWVASMPADRAYLMVAKTLTSLRRNCLDLLQTLVGTANFIYSIPQKQGLLFGRMIYLEGANDLRAETKIRGMTLQGAYCDELTLFTEDFFAMLLSRLSERGARLLATTNPDTPTHWLKENYLDREADLDILSVRFTIDDNPYLDLKYVENIKKEYTGSFYSRFILGEWTRAEGLIYSLFDVDKHVVPTIDRAYSKYQVSVDYGTKDPHSMGLWGLCDGIWYRVREYYHDGRKSGEKTDEQYYQDLLRFTDDLKIHSVIVDPSAASFITTIRCKFPVWKANNTVLDGIRCTASALHLGLIKFNDCCANTIKSFQSYSWDDKSKDEKPLHENSHAPDDVRYFVYTTKLVQSHKMK
jgi:PBSX family phage terminase large subunit